jgi:hypothetical protein
MGFARLLESRQDGGARGVGGRLGATHEAGRDEEPVEASAGLERSRAATGATRAVGAGVTPGPGDVEKHQESGEDEEDPEEDERTHDPRGRPLIQRRGERDEDHSDEGSDQNQWESRVHGSQGFLAGWLVNGLERARRNVPKAMVLRTHREGPPRTQYLAFPSTL